MDAKDLRSQPALSDRHNEGSKYAQSGGIALQCDRNKTYQDIGSMAKLEVQNARPCAVIGPDRIVPPHATNEACMKKGPAEPWPCADNTYRRPPEYPRKLSNYASPSRNISPRQTYQENMQRIMVPATYNSVKINDDANYAQIPDRNSALSKNIKLNVPAEAKYCDVPYTVNPNSNEPKNVRNSEMCVSSVNPPLSRTAPHQWQPASVNIRPARSYGAPELYQYQEYPSCAGPRPIVPRPHRTHPDEPGYVYADPYYTDGNIRFKPYPSVKDRYPAARYDYIGNYTNPFHPPPSYPPHKYDVQKSMPTHPFSPYGPVKYLDNRVPEPSLDGFQRNQQSNYNMPYPNQVIHPNYGTVIGNCSQNKMHSFPTDSSIKSIAPNKLPYDTNNKTYVEYDNSRPKIYPPSDSYFVSEMSRLHPMKSQVLMPNYPNLNMHTGPPNQYYKKDNAQMKNYEYMAHLRNMDPMMSIHNPMMRHAPMFSPNTLAISPTDSSASNDTNQTLGASQEDCGYVSQSSTASVRSMDSGINRVPHEYYRRYYDSRYGHLVRTSPMMAKTELLSNSNTSKDKKNIDVRQFFQMWNEGDEETVDTNSNDIVNKLGSSNDNKLTKKHEVASNHEQLYVLGLVNVPSEELSKYEHIQTVSKLPENIKGYNNIELLNNFEEAIESSNLGNFKPLAPKENFQMPIKGLPPKQVAGILPRPVSPLDVEAKISQSIIHKEVGCNFEIKPCSPKMLNVDVAAPIQNILAERVIEKVANPVRKSPMLNSIDKSMDCNLMKRQDHRLNMNGNVRVASCKMINTQYSNINPIDPIKSTYSLQDLESNSGLCLASLPRLDNDIELNFPEVNQQFINANRGEAAVITSSFKDLPTLDILDQSDSEIKHTDGNTQVIRKENKVDQPLSNAEPEKEFSKLSKYRKNKPNIPEDFERKSLVIEEKQQTNQNAIRTDSVIIKNPENIKKYENSDFSSNCFNEPQQAPMNLTSQVNYDEKNTQGNGIEDYSNTKNDEKQSTDIAIDFSLNKNNLVSVSRSPHTEMNTQKVNSIQELEGNIHRNKTCDEDPSDDLIFNTKHDNHESIEDDGHTDNCNSNNVDYFETPARGTEDNITIDLNQDTNDCVKDTNISQHKEDKVIKITDEQNIDNATSEDYTNLESILTSENTVLESLPLLNDSSGGCIMEDDCNNAVPENQLSEETNNLIKMDVENCEFQKECSLDIDKELEMICKNNNTQSELEQTMVKQAEPDIETNSTNGNDEENGSVLVFSPQNKTCCQKISLHEESNNKFGKSVSPEIENLATANLRNSPLKEDVIINQINNVTSHNVLNVYDDTSLSHPTEDLETNKMECYKAKDPSVQDTQNEVWNKTTPFYDKDIKSNGTRRCLQLWSKKMFSPWIQNLLSFSEGNVNMQKKNEIISDIITDKSHVENSQNIDNVVEPIEEHKSIKNKDILVRVTDAVVTCDSNSSNITNLCDSVDEIASKTEPEVKNNDEINTTTEENMILNNIIKDECKNDINETQTNIRSPNIEPILEDVKENSVISDINNSVYDGQNETVMSPKRESLADEDKAIILEDSSVPDIKNVCEDIKNQIQNLGLPEPFHTEETYNSFQEEATGESELAESDNIIENAIGAEDSKKSCNKMRCDDIEALFKKRRPLKRSLSDSALHIYNVDENQERDGDAVQLVLPIKRRKINKFESVELCSIIQHNRRNSISAICNEGDVSFCILIDNSCIIAEEEESEEQKICYTEFSEGCLEIQNDSTNAENDENIETMAPVITSPQVNVQCEYSDSFTLEREEDKALDSWVEDVACVETVISDDIAEDIVISEPLSPKEGYCSENDESGVFSSSEHTDKVKYIYGEMCSDDAQYLETLYKTPQMDVNKALNSRETHVIGESVKYYDKDSLEKVLSESNGKEPYSFEFMNSIMPMSVSNCNTPDDKENIMDIFSPPQSNLNCEDIELNHEQENLLPASMFSQTRNDAVHSCESSIDDVFTYKHEPKAENTNSVTSSSPEVSSTTSEERNSAILLKITNYKGSRISQINGITAVNNSPSCKFTEEKDYLHSHSNFSKNRPLLTKAAQKYIPPLKESIRDLKVKLTLPQHSLMKLKQLKTSKDIPKPIKQNNNNIMSRIPKKPKPKFEDVLMSIDEIQFKKHKEKTKKAKKSIPKVIIKKTQNGSHYASTSNKGEFNPDLTGRKWQPWVFLEKNLFIDRMAIRNETKAIYSHRKKCYVLAKKFKKYKAVNNAKFVISQPKTDNSSTGLKYTIRLKHSY